MTNTIIDVEGIDIERFEDFSFLLPTTVELSDTSIEWATQAVKAISDADEQWNAFLQALAIAGFKQWLEEGAIAFKNTYPLSHSQALRPYMNLQVDDYQVCIIAMGGWFENSVEVFVNSPTGTEADGCRLAHLYVLVEVQTEINRAYIMGGLTQAQVIQQIGTQPVSQQQTLEVPVSSFDIPPEEILLYLGCLESVAFIRTEPERNHPQTIPGGIINAGAWLKNTVDEVCGQLNWALLPPVATAMRSVRGDDMHRVLRVLSTQGVLLPVKAKGIGGPIKVGSFTCQIYAWVWTVDTHKGTEWVLFFLLGPQDGEYLPAGLQLQVTDCSNVLTEGMLEQPSNEAYLYTQVQGGFEEEFLVRIILPNGVRMALPTFNFETI